MKQEITVTIELGQEQKPYELVEHGDYEALKHFFEDINYKVTSILSVTTE